MKYILVLFIALSVLGCRTVQSPDEEAEQVSESEEIDQLNEYSIGYEVYENRLIARYPIGFNLGSDPIFTATAGKGFIDIDTKTVKGSMIVTYWTSYDEWFLSDLNDKLEKME